MEPLLGAGAMPVILAGMHRSGTSFAASVLQAAGVAMGERMYAADRGNVKGHFEDMDFLEVHRAALAELGLDETGWTEASPLNLPAAVAAQGRALAAGRAAAFDAGGASAWGWKDPRTTLFLDDWRELLPGARFVLMYREPWEVADSLFRRATDKGLLENPRRAVDMWNAYNRRVVAFARRHPEQTLIISNDAATADAGAFVAAVNGKFGLHLDPPPEAIFDPEVMIKQEAGSWREGVVADLSPEALALYGELQALAAMKGRDATTSVDRQGQAEQLVREWAQQRVGRVKNRELQGALDGLVVKYGRVYSEGISLRRQLARAGAIIGVMAEVEARPRGLGASVKGALRRPVWETAALRPIAAVEDPEGALPEVGLLLRHLFAGPFEPGRYSGRITLKGATEARLAFAGAGGVEIVGALGTSGADDVALCELTLTEGAAIGMISLPVGGEVVGFRMERQ